ncbi:hypothetical protein G6F63_016711 [Rhizopus arrhizus]|nr:hypothetical protein G6F63_016711 [Rhizopus arrhizus]
MAVMYSTNPSNPRTSMAASSANRNDPQDRADADQAGQGQERALAEVERLGRGVGDAETERDQGIDAAHGQSTQYGL